ncbi:site-specific integrase [Caproiciproducens galactitolivorans]|uniref:site-specific integrase n=1 Tax=Caproiciproducens galactitolivorans TaxID=642589 RepID=UPI00240A4894|nr:site-specific integrase [Caproiciproducens galactitolivorans]
MKNCDFAYYLSNFFTTYLPGHLNVSENTVYSYRDTFTRLLTYFKDERSVPPDKLKFSHFSRDSVEDFLKWLENTSHCGISTRNQRLAAIKSFFRYVQVEQPEYLMLCQSIISIRSKKSPKPTIQYLTGEEMKLLLEQPDTADRNGRRDLALLSLLYDSAARVQEICDLTVRNLRLTSPPVVRLNGKGRKIREVPLSAPCADILRKYMQERKLDRQDRMDEPLFFNSQGRNLTRSGVSFILAKYISKANAVSPHSLPSTITPHCIRYSKAMHLLESGVNLIYIRDFLGHESIETTQIYAKANPEKKRAAISKTCDDSSAPKMPDWNDNPDLMSFLKGL